MHSNYYIVSVQSETSKEKRLKQDIIELKKTINELKEIIIKKIDNISQLEYELEFKNIYLQLNSVIREKYKQLITKLKDEIVEKDNIIGELEKTIKLLTPSFPHTHIDKVNPEELNKPFKLPHEEFPMETHYLWPPDRNQWSSTISRDISTENEFPQIIISQYTIECKNNNDFTNAIKNIANQMYACLEKQEGRG